MERKATYNTVNLPHIKMGTKGKRKCRKCFVEKEVTEYYKKKGGGVDGWCKPCTIKRNRDYSEKSNYYKKNVVRLLEEKKDYRKKNISWINNKRRKDRKELADWYIIKSLITGTVLKKSDITKEMIEAKRMLMLLKREMIKTNNKEMENGKQN